MMNERYKKYVERIKRLRLMDDDFMKICFRDNLPAISCILQVILEKPDLQAKSVKVEYVVNNLRGHGVRFDIFATDSENIPYNIEIQRSNKGAGRKRARYNSGVLDTGCLPKGTDTDKLPDTYVIFITENDVLQRAQSIYHIDRCILETKEAFDDGGHIIYVNGAYRGNDAIGKLVHDFRATAPEDMNYEPLKEIIKRFKYTEEGCADMCKEFEEVAAEGRAEGHAEGRLEGQIDIANNMLKKNIDINLIAELTGLTVSQIEMLATNKTIALNHIYS